MSSVTLPFYFINKLSPLEEINFQEGAVWLVDKPLKWTSFQVVKKLRYQFKLKKIGHAGTLDPLATGLLILCIGKATKSISLFQSLPKTYKGTFELGKTTPSFDAETSFDATFPYHHITQNDILNVLPKFIGNIEQVPPRFSALKQNGKRLYEKARRGIEFTPKPRGVNIHWLKITSFNLPQIGFEVCCSKGTYIRSLAHDIGQSLNCGAYLTSLRRTAIGSYNVEDAYILKSLFNQQNTTHTT